MIDFKKSVEGAFVACFCLSSFAAAGIIIDALLNAWGVGGVLYIGAVVVMCGNYVKFR